MARKIVIGIVIVVVIRIVIIVTPIIVHAAFIYWKLGTVADVFGLMLHCRMVVVVVSFVTRMPSRLPHQLTSSAVARRKRRRREEDRE